MGRLDGLNTYSASEKAAFQKICRKLLKMTFIVREKNEEHRKDFYFINAHHQDFREYFQCIGYDVMCDQDTGVAQLVNIASSGDDNGLNSNRKNLTLEESIVLTALWLRYEDEMVNGGLTRSVSIDKVDLDYQLEQVGARNRITKTSMQKILELFESYNLIKIEGKLGEPDCKIRIYTSMQFGLSESDFRILAETTAAKMTKTNKEKTNSAEEGRTNEQTA